MLSASSRSSFLLAPYYPGVVSRNVDLQYRAKTKGSFICKCAQSVNSTGSLTMSNGAASSTAVLVNGCAGKMGRAVAEAVLTAGLHLVPLSFTSPELGQHKLQIRGTEVDVLTTSDKESIFHSVLKDHPDVIVVDFTVPSVVNENAELYCKVGVPFVLGTTGGDRDKLIATVKQSNNYAVIAPQMGKQVVAFQAAMKIMAEQFPGAFSGYSLKVTESHQSGKLDTSGTAKAIVSSFQKLGIDFSFDQIEKVRDPQDQIQKMGVPEQYLDGHAFHTYTLKSPDSTVVFQFQHNVCGRSIYAQGTVDAVIFLANKVRNKAEKKLYDMIDVLREGNMR